MTKKSWSDLADFLSAAEYYIAHHEQGKTAEQLFVEMQWVIDTHKDFESYCNENNIRFHMPRKSQVSLERRKLFINWYVEKVQETKTVMEIISDLEMLTFSSQSTIIEDLKR